MGQKNVLLFITDGHRTDMLGCYGNRLLKTPNVDALAGEGVIFRQAFCTHSVCMPTRASIFTGRYPHIHGVWANGVPLRRTEVTLPQVLADNGYATCAAGKVHFEPQEAYLAERMAPIVETPYYGFEEVHLSENLLGKEYLQFIDERHPELSERARQRDRMPEEAHDLQWITDRAISFIERQAAIGRPFLCSCSFHELIPPCTPPEGFIGLYDPADMPVPELRESDLDKKPPFYRQCYEGYLQNGRHPDEPTLRRYIASCYDQMTFIDKQFGRLVEALKRAGVWEETIVLFTADHGLSLNDHYQWRHGPFLFDQVINVPMIWRVPAPVPWRESAGRSRVPPPVPWRESAGRSRVPPPVPWRESAGRGLPAPGGAVTEEMAEGVDIMPTILDLCGVAAPPGVQGRSLTPLIWGEQGARGRDSVLIQERQAPDLIARGLEPDPIWQVGLRTRDWKLIHFVDYPYGELYDLKNDPGEFDNLWADPRYLPQRREMEATLMERLAAAQDPLPVREYGW